MLYVNAKSLEKISGDLQRVQSGEREGGGEPGGKHPTCMVSLK